jgi:hypothetical protein
MKSPHANRNASFAAQHSFGLIVMSQSSDRQDDREAACATIGAPTAVTSASTRIHRTSPP